MQEPLMSRVIVHWTAGGAIASTLDKEHYNFLVQQDLKVIEGKHTPGDNLVTGDGIYAAHTRGLNSGSIGVGMCGMRNAKEDPFVPGPSPITQDQFHVTCGLIAELCRKHGIPVTPQTVLTHAEVETNLGVKQHGKWDISVLPWDHDCRGSRAVGDHMREMVLAQMGIYPPKEATRPTLEFGARGVSVAELQTDLADLGYFSGRIDGDFGPLTRAALLAFQADNGLTTDAIAGPMTWSALGIAAPRPAREISMEEIDETSGTAKDARMASRVGDFLGLGGVATLATQVNTASHTLGAASSALESISATLTNNWPVVMLCAACVFGAAILKILSTNTRQRRLQDAREHRSLAR